MTKKVEPGESPSNKLPERPVNLPQLHNSNQTEEGKQALFLIHKYFVSRKTSTFDYLAHFIIETSQTFKNYEAFMYANEYDNLFFRKTVEEAYYDGLRWKHKEAGFIRVWCVNGVINYVCAANFNMISKFRRKKHSSPDLVPYDVKVEAISNLKKALLISE